MSEQLHSKLFAERIGGSQYGKSGAIYKFEKIKRAKRAAMAAHPGAEIIDMGVGEPDEMAFRPSSTAYVKKRETAKPGLCRQWRRRAEQAAAKYLEKFVACLESTPNQKLFIPSVARPRFQSCRRL
jgi:LL-diaminopimelate aminotransferase